MNFIAEYTTIIAPAVFFVLSIFIVMLLNKFIGKQKTQDRSS